MAEDTDGSPSRVFISGYTAQEIKALLEAGPEAAAASFLSIRNGLPVPPDVAASLTSQASTYPFPDREHVRKMPVVARFVLQVISGTVMFLLLGGAAVGLGFAVRWTETLPIPGYVDIGLQGVELLLFAADLLSMTIFVFSETASLIDVLIPGRRQAVGRGMKRLFSRRKGRGTP